MIERSAHSIREKADAAFLRAAGDVIEEARRFGTPIVVYENGKVAERTWQEMEAVLAKNPKFKRSAPNRD